MSEEIRYYNSGFEKRDILICEECQKDEENKIDNPLMTISFEFKGYEGLMRIIKQNSLPQGEDGYNYIVDFYGMAKTAYNKSYCFREYLKFLGVDNANKIDKNLKQLWPFTYRIVSRQEPRIYTSGIKGPDKFSIQWRRDAARHMIFDGKMMEDFERDEKKPIIRD